MNNYKKFAAKFCGVELLIIALANIVYYVTANNQEPCISRVQDKTETIYRIIYTQTDDRTWVLMDIASGILFLLSVFLICYIGKKIIKPFEQMQSLTEDLAKGNLSVPICKPFNVLSLSSLAVAIIICAFEVSLILEQTE